MKKKLLTTAVLASIAGTAGAVNVNPDGLGQVGLFPYYTVQDGNSTLIYITNTTSNGKIVKVRFLEGKNSLEVLDFNLYLSKNDIWTAAIEQDGTGAKIVTTDASCTVPAIPTAGQPFSNLLFTDGEDTTLARTREGHLEVIEMGTMSDALDTAFAGAAAPVAGNQTPFKPNAWAQHNSSGVPFSCTNLTDAWDTANNWGNGAIGDEAVGLNSGGLYAGAFIINGAAGTGNQYNATMLDAFNTLDILHSEPGDTEPNLTAANPATSYVFNNGAVVASTFTLTSPSDGLNAVTATLMHSSVLNEYSVETGLAASTDWVITHPTKKDYVPFPTVLGAWTAIPPFTTRFGVGLGGSPQRNGALNPIVTLVPTTGGACEVVKLDLYDREERTTTTGLSFSPRQPGGSDSLCWETNVITFDNTDALGSVGLRLNVNVPASFPEKNGWMRLTLSQPLDGHTLTSTDGDVYGGLPTIGFAVENFVNGNVTAGVLANYGVSFDHRFTRSISSN